MDTYEEILNAAIDHMERRVGLALDLLKRLQFSKSQGQHYAVTCLHSRSIHLAAGCASVAKARATPCIPIIVRSMWEADVDLDNLIANPQYSQNMYASFLAQKLHFSGAASPEKNNPFLLPVHKAIDLNKLMAEIRNELATLRKNGHQPLSVKARAEHVSREAEYDAIYGSLCLDAHNNLLSLEGDHVKHHPSGDYSISFYGDKMTPGAVADMLLAVGLLTISIEKTHKLLNTQDERLPALFQTWLQDRAILESEYQRIENDENANKALQAIGAKARLQPER